MQAIFGRSKQTGFTLLELLIAITVFSIISTITYSGLKTVLDAQQQNQEHLDGLSQVQIGLNIVQRDIEQAVLRPVRDEFGDPTPAMRSGDLTGMLVEFTHGGYANPLGIKRSRLQRVAYQLEDEKLYRITWPTLDRAQGTNPRKSLLLERVRSLEITYYDQKMKPHKEWPATTPGEDPNAQYPLPKAIEMLIEMEKLGRIRRLFRVTELVDR